LILLLLGDESDCHLQITKGKVPEIVSWMKPSDVNQVKDC